MNFAYMDNPRLYGSGNAIQHLHYLPFGEDWVDQRNSSWNTPYTFSGKEKDVETGYGYFGARYYDSGLSIWLSVDPMSDKYPSMSPYNYCANNPVMLVDPNGMEIVEGGPDDPLKKLKDVNTNNVKNINSISWGETSGLYPTKNMTPSQAELDDPTKWDPDKLSQLLAARAAIKLIGEERNTDVHKKTNSFITKYEKLLAKFHLSDNFPEVDKEIKDNKNVKYFYLSPDKNAKTPAISDKYYTQKIVKVYGPFYNIGGGDVSKGKVYIIFYEAVPKVTPKKNTKK